MVKNANRFAAIVVALCSPPAAVVAPAVAFNEIPDFRQGDLGVNQR